MNGPLSVVLEGRFTGYKDAMDLASYVDSLGESICHSIGSIQEILKNFSLPSVCAGCDFVANYLFVKQTKIYRIFF